MENKYLVCIGTEPRFYIARPAAQRADPSKKFSPYELCWVEISSGAILSGETNWAISLSEVEELMTR